MGVVIGALSVASDFLTDSMVLSGMGVPYLSMMSTPASQGSHSMMPAPGVVLSAASMVNLAAAASSGPVPSPRISVTVWFDIALFLSAKIVSHTLIAQPTRRQPAKNSSSEHQAQRVIDGKVQLLHKEGLLAGTRMQLLHFSPRGFRRFRR